MCVKVRMCVREKEAERCVKILKKKNIKSFDWLKMVNRPSRSRNQSRKINQKDSSPERYSMKLKIPQNACGNELNLLFNVLRKTNGFPRL